MSMTFEEIQALANAEAEDGVDMTVAQKGGGGRLLPAGYAFGRLVEYIEYGMHPQEYQGKAKDPALEFSLAFALWGEGYANEDGTPYIIRPYRMARSRNDKAKAFLLFQKLNWKGTAKNFAQLLGQAFLVKIVHADKSQTDKTKVSRIDFTGFLPPLDPVTKQPYAIPEAPADSLRLFLWNRPTMAGWKSLFIEGTTEDGKSKNYVQETILSAVDFHGSPLQQMLGAVQGQGLPSLPSSPSVPPSSPAAPSGQPQAGVALPSLPAAPSAPVGLPSLPSLPSVPDAPV